MRFPSNRVLLGGAGVVAGWLALVACNGTSVAVVDDDAGDAGADVEGADVTSDATSEAGADATVDGTDGSRGTDGSDGSSAADSSDGSPAADTSTDQGAPAEASADASEGGPVESGVDAGGGDASDGGLAEAGDDGEASETGEDAGSDAASGASDSAVEASSDGSSTDAPNDAASCSFAGQWSMTVQNVTAVPTLCQGVMDCTNCDIMFNATSTLPTPSTIDWSVSPGGTLCTQFTGGVSAGGQFQTNETDCSPVGNGSTFDGQIDLPTCSVAATYIYVLNNCTVTMTMTGAQ